MSDQNKILESPRIAGLKKSLEIGEVGALERFWQRVSAEGVPLIEPIPGDEKYGLVTFLYRADETTHHVVLHSELLRGMWWDRWSDALLERLPNTDLFYRSYRVPVEMRFVYWLSPNRPLVHISRDVEDTDHYLHIDPLNPRVFRQDLDRSYVEMPAAPAQPWWQERDGVPRGTLEMMPWHSPMLGNDRTVWIYRPAGAMSGMDPLAFLLLFDGDIFTTYIPGSTILDNLIAEKRIPPLVVLMLDSPNRSEELYCSERFTDFLAGELVPWSRQSLPVTHDPAQSVVGGVSAGGLAAAFTALRHPELFGNILSNSGAFQWSKDAYASKLWSYAIPPEDCWLAQEFAARERLPLRFHLDAGLLEDQRDHPYTTLLERQPAAARRAGSQRLLAALPRDLRRAPVHQLPRDVPGWADRLAGIRFGK